MHRISLLVGVAVLAAAGSSPSLLAAQGAGATASGANVITVAAIARHVGIIAHDSMLGRDTPSRGLELTAEYIVGEFRKLGLKPAEGTAWIQRFPLIGDLAPSYAASHLAFSVRSVQDGRLARDNRGQILEQRVVSFGNAARFAVDTLPQSGAQGEYDWTVRASVFVVVGPHTLHTLRQAGLRDKIVFYLPPADADSARQHQTVDLLRASNRVVILSDEDSATFAARRQAAVARPAIVRLIYHIGQSIADADHDPTWTQSGRQNRLATFFGQ